MDGVEVGEGARVRDAIVGPKCRLGRMAFLERCVIGDEASVGDGAQVAPSLVRVGPYLSIAPYSTLSSDYMAP